MLNIVDLVNLVVLARKGMSVLSENIQVEQADAAWKAIKNAEDMIKKFKEEQEKAQANTQSTPVKETNVETVNFNG